MASISSIPILDLSLARRPETKAAFLSSLRHALLEVGFLYIENTGISEEVAAEVVKQGKAFFDLPMEKKLEVEMVNVYENYISKMGEVAQFFTSLVAEAIGLAPDAFDRFFDESQQHKLKIVKYPDVQQLGGDEGGGERQGVGPHKDSMLTSYLLQVPPHRGLQVQNPAGGNWIDVPPIPGTLVVAIGQGLEALTSGVCTSTTHRVLSPPAGAGPRYSIPFFQGVSYDATFESMDVPEEVKTLKREIDGPENGTNDVEFTFVKGRWQHLGEATMANRVRSHVDVGERWVGASTISIG
ncbi:MAG: hypothetical protein M1832_005245 [Thelocarpon impressellum]|nr:MAG: hypothetical protein M1832_005245 [Thelocarpon impressellum]